MSPAPVTVPPPTTASALDAIVDLLDLRRCSGPPSGRATLGLVSGRSGPRFLVPTSYPDAAPQACLAYLGLRDARTRLARGAVGWALRARATRLVIGDTYEVEHSEDEWRQYAIGDEVTLEIDSFGNVTDVSPP